MVVIFFHYINDIYQEDNYRFYLNAWRSNFKLINFKYLGFDKFNCEFWKIIELGSILKFFSNIKLIPELKKLTFVIDETF